MRQIVIFAAFVVLSLVIATSVFAQQTCSDFVTQALQQMSTNCGDMSRNTACYGYNNVTAALVKGVSPDVFIHPNDRVDLVSLQSITTAPLDVQTSQWGIAVMKAQANLPDALPGEAVTFLLLGDVHLQTGVTQGSDMKPMQAVYFTTGIGGTKCSDAPDSSLIIQGPKDITVNLSVNGANVQLGSTAIFRSTPNSSMSCGVVDGAAVVGPDKDVIPAGFAARVPLDAQLNANGDWGNNQTIADQDATALQVLKNIPPGVLNYAPDVPTAQEVDIMGALDPGLIQALDPHLMRNMVHLLVAEGATSQLVAIWDVKQLRDFIASNANKVVVATAEPQSTSEAAATQEVFTPDFLQSLLAALDSYSATPSS